MILLPKFFALTTTKKVQGENTTQCRMEYYPRGKTLPVCKTRSLHQFVNYSRTILTSTDHKTREQGALLSFPEVQETEIDSFPSFLNPHIQILII